VRSKQYWLSQKWGKIRVDPNQELAPEWASGVNKKITFICDCGKTTEKLFTRVTQGSSEQSCARCLNKSKDYWLEQRWGNLVVNRLETLPEEWSPNSGLHIPLLCDCGKTTSPIFWDVTQGHTQSCGCLLVGRDSKLSVAGEIYQWILSLRLEAEWDRKIPGSRKSYDIYLPVPKVAIEYHGLLWHSERFSKSPMKDYRKYLAALEQGIRLIQIYQDEWESNPELVKDLILSSCGIRSRASRSLPNYRLLSGTTPEQNQFLEQHHYLGRSGGCLTIEARHKNQLIGVWVFKKVTQTRVEWVRACWHRGFKAWNPHGKVLQLALPELKQLGFTEIVSFSDNRLHTGELYEHLGFELDGDVKPGYDYTNFQVRRHRSKFMVPAGTDERSVAADQGWYRIWDSGKKRWLLKLHLEG
jgi:hypothetical protein